MGMYGPTFVYCIQLTLKLFCSLVYETLSIVATTDLPLSPRSMDRLAIERGESYLHLTERKWLAKAHSLKRKSEDEDGG